jgi:hypothetical protein
MFCLKGVYLLDNLRMTGVAGCLLSLPLQNDIQGLMGIIMTAQTVGSEFEMGFSFMTLVTFRNKRACLDSRGVLSIVTLHTGNFRFMLVSSFLDLLDNYRMTLHTVVIFEFDIAAESSFSTLAVCQGKKKTASNKSYSGQDTFFFHDSPPKSLTWY